jgi:hypothetical protein
MSMSDQYIGEIHGFFYIQYGKWYQRALSERYQNSKTSPILILGKYLHKMREFLYRLPCESLFGPLIS